MSKGGSIHPTIRFAAYLSCGLGALFTLGLATYLNLHSVPWLFSIYATTVLFIFAIRIAKSSPLNRAYAIYLAMLCQYLICVWILHVLAPGDNMSIAKKNAAWWAWYFYPGLIYNAQAHLHFAIRFANVRSRVIRGIEAACMAVSTFFLIQNFFGLFVVDYVWAGFTWVPTLDGGYRYFFPYTTFLLTLGVGIVIAQAIRCRIHRHRLQLIYFIIGDAPVWLCCWGNFLISWGVNIYPAGGLMFLLHICVIAYAVFQHRLFDFTIAIRRALAYAAVSTLLGIIYGTVLWLGTRLEVVNAHIQSAFSGAIFVAIAGMLYSPMLDYVQRLIDNLFFRRAVERQQVLAEFCRETASTLRLASVAESLCRALQCCYQPRSVTLYLKDEDGKYSMYGVFTDRFRMSQWPVGFRLKNDLEMVLLKGPGASRIPPASTDDAANSIGLSENGESLLLPVMHRGECLGCAILEPKRADEEYDDADISLAETFAAHSSSAFLKSRYFARLEGLQRLTQRTLEELSAGVILLSGAGNILQWNNNAKNLFTANEQELPINVTGLWAMHPELGREIRHALAELVLCTNKELPLSGTGKRVVLLTVSHLGADESHDKFLVIIHEITEYKQMRALANHREALARIGEAISKINHEIKNIIQPIKYQIELLKRVESDNRIVKRVAHIVPDRLAALDRLLSNLRDLSKPIELRKRPIAILELVDSVWNDLKDSREAAGIHFVRRGEESLSCIADGHYLRQVLYNLIKNALEAVSGAQKPEIVVAALACGETTKICIKDNGCGIGSESRTSLFRPFYSTKGEGGTGLGLSICKRIVEMHGGNITVESEPSAGTTFYLTFPSSDAVSMGASSSDSFEI